ncbi:MAG: invasin domain 3-containing protein, partial [bacterium]
TGLTGVNALKFHIMDPGPGGATDNNSIYAEIAAYAAAPSLADAGTSTVTAFPTNVASDGVTASMITVTLKDANTNAVPGKTVTLASSRGALDSISAASGLSSGSGVVTFTVTSTNAGSSVFTATDTNDSVTVTQTATVTFLSAAVSAANSTVTAYPTSVAADGATTSTVTVTVKDSSSAAISGKTVTLVKTSGPGNPTITTIAGTTDGSGVATFTVQSTTAGADVFTATADSVAITQTATVTFTAGAVAAGTSTVVASPTIVPANGTAASTITVTLLDANSNPVTNKTVSLDSSRGVTDTISGASGPSSASGVVTFTVTSTNAGASVFTATGDSVELSTKPVVTFGASAAASTVVADPTSVPADGTTTSTITVTLKDGSNNAVTNKTVTLVSSRTSTDTITTASNVSDVSGVVTFTVSSTKAGAPVFTATDTTDGVTVTQTAIVTFTVGAVSATQSTVAASPASVMANGTATSTITVTLKDAYTNLVAGKTVTLAHTSGPGTPVITTVSGTTSDSGVATFTVKSTTVGADVFTATDDTDSLPITQTATVTFTTVPATITWGLATDDTLNGGSTAFLETDVKTNGKFVAAVCNGTAGTVNGVTFTGWTAYSGAPEGIITYGSSPVSLRWTADNPGNRNQWGSPSNKYGNFGYGNGPSINLLLTGGGDGNSPGTITLSSLIAGNTYQVQIWAPTWDNTFNISVGGVNVRVGNPPGSLSQYVVGTFTANGESQPISWSGIAPSAISVRDVSLPKGTLIMIF